MGRLGVFLRFRGTRTISCACPVDMHPAPQSGAGTTRPESHHPPQNKAPGFPEWEGLEFFYASGGLEPSSTPDKNRLRFVSGAVFCYFLHFRRFLNFLNKEIFAMLRLFLYWQSFLGAKLATDWQQKRGRSAKPLPHRILLLLWLIVSKLQAFPNGKAWSFFALGGT